MFMFRSKRNQLVKKLWKAQALSGEEEGEEDKVEATNMLKRLKKKQLEVLLRVVESKGRDMGDCCLVPKEEVILGKKRLSPHLLVCKVFRWKDLPEEAILVRLPLCTMTREESQLYSCCNPYHWARLVQHQGLMSVSASPLASLPGNNIDYNGRQNEKKTTNTTDNKHPHVTDRLHVEKKQCTEKKSTNPDPPPGEPPPPYCIIKDIGSNGRDPHGVQVWIGSVATEESSDFARDNLKWCTLAYWEERTRVGAQFPSHLPSCILEVYLAPTKHPPTTDSLRPFDSLSLSDLFNQNPRPSRSTLSTRTKIGLGILLHQDEQGVWVHNRSEGPLFVNSPTLDQVNSRQFSVIKVPPGYSIEIFDFQVAQLYDQVRDPCAYEGPYDPRSVRISFTKGWGSAYHRPSVECCPCWLELFLPRNRDSYTHNNSVGLHRDPETQVEGLLRDTGPALVKFQQCC